MYVCTTGESNVAIRGGIAKQNTLQLPEFKAPIGNVTTPVGREAVLTCTVDHIGKYKVSFVSNF